jgi:hypothetical protein
MLQEQAWRLGDICSIKLITGDEIVAKVVNHDSTSITIVHPMALSMNVDRDSQQPTLQMLPTLLISGRKDSKMKIALQHVITMAVSEDAAKQAYDESVQTVAKR